MDPMSDAALEKELERALAVDPSPEFVARVRMRVAEEPSPMSRGFGWLFAAGAAAVAAAAVLTIIVGTSLRQAGPSQVLTSRAIVDPIRVTGLDPIRMETSTVDPNRTAAARRGRPIPADPAHWPAATNAQASVLFDARETTALQRLIANVRDARVDLSPLLKEAPMPMPSGDDLVIPPIVIKPLETGGIEGERP